jgi:hypothetical protein
VADAAKAKDEWEKDYRCDDLEEYYLGHQHGDEEGDPYTINLVFPSIEVKIPSFLYAYPTLRVTPRPAKADDLGSEADATCRLLEDTGQTLMTSRNVGWKDAHYYALQEAFYRFGVVEHGYSTEIGDNPNGGKPMLDDDDEPMRDDDDNMIVQPDQVPIDEQVWSRRIPAKQFLAPAVSHNEVLYNDWLGYYEWMHPEDIKATRGWENTDQKMPNKGQLKSKFRTTLGGTEEERNKRYGLVKVWKVRDLRTRTRLIWPEGGEAFLVYGEKFKILPFSILRFHPILDSFYPLPPVFNWLSPQDELNETRNEQRAHRRKARRRYTMLKNAVESGELDKLEAGPDQTVIEVNRQDALQPLEAAPLDRSVDFNVAQTQQDFMRISGVGGEQQGVNEAETATQANIIDTNSKIRDTYGRRQIADWVSSGMYAMLSILRDSSALPIVVMVNVDWSSPGAFAEAEKVAAKWKQIEANDLGAFDFDVTVDIESMSPMNEDQRRQNWNQVLSVFANPTLMQVMMSSETIMRKTMGYYGVKSDRELQEIRVAIGMVLQQLAAAAQAQAEAKGVGGGKQTGAGGTGPGPTPGNTDIAKQLQASMGRPN